MGTTTAPKERIDAATGEVIEAGDRVANLAIVNEAEVNMQVATAKRYPRSIKKFKEKCRSMALLDGETAASCFYALPRAGKSIEGPSARLAEIVASSWGNLRAEARIVEEGEKHVTCEGLVWDLETNVAVKVQVRRRITDKNKKRYNEDLITNAVNAGNSIAFRNAVFKVVPGAYVRPIYEEARKAAIGNARTLATSRANMIEYFAKMGISPERILQRLDKPGIEDLTLDDLGILKGVATAIQEDTLNVDEAFPEVVMAVPNTNGKKEGFGFKDKGKDPEAEKPPADAPEPEAEDPATKAELERQMKEMEAAHAYDEGGPEDAPETGGTT